MTIYKKYIGVNFQNWFKIHTYLKFVGKISRVIVIRTFTHTTPTAKKMVDNARTLSEFGATYRQQAVVPATAVIVTAMFV